MPDNKATYDKLIGQIDRLSGGDYEVFIDKYIFEMLPDFTILTISKTKKGIAKPNLLSSLNVIAVEKHTQKVITLMEASDNLKEFDKLINKQKENTKEKPPDKEKTDFDKVLGALMKVPKKKDDKAAK